MKNAAQISISSIIPANFIDLGILDHLECQIKSCPWTDVGNGLLPAHPSKNGGCCGSMECDWNFLIDQSIH
jgi:hypothetical protein